MKLAEQVHGAWVHDRRTRVLSARLSSLIPHGAQVVDVGCGDGLLARRIAAARPDLSLSGLDVLARPGAHIPVQPFDGRALPLSDASVDVVMLVDVLHHALDPKALLAEAARVARGAVVIKDHLREGLWAGPTLAFMDRVGNERFGVALPFNYWTRAQWRAGLATAGLGVEAWTEALGLYPWPFDWVFGRSLHFAARLRPAGAPVPA